MNEIVYVLTNAAMPDLVKIGKTTRKDPEVRMNELYTTGVPVPFECAYAIRVEDSTKVEQALHDAFDNQRPNPKREFFKIGTDSEDGVYRVRAILELLVEQYGAEDVTPEINKERDSLSKEERISAEKLDKGRRPNYNFLKMGIPPGSKLIFATVKDQKTDRIAEVIDERRVLFDGEEMLLTNATRLALEQETGVYQQRGIKPTRHWYYGDSYLHDLWRGWTDHVLNEVYEGQSNTDG